MTKARRRDAQFPLHPGERATYGATITARSLETGATRTFARTETTAMQALVEIIGELDLLPGAFRVLTISTPVTIRRDIYASRVALDGTGRGLVGGTPEDLMLRKIGRTDMLHPSILRMSARNS